MAGKLPQQQHLDCSEDKQVVDFYNIFYLCGDRFVQGFRNDYVSAVAMHGFNVWEVNKHCK